MIENVVRVIDLVPGTVQAMRAVEASTLTDARFLEEFVNRHEPVLIKGALKDWPAFKSWQEPGYLESLCGDRQVRVGRTFNANPYFKTDREQRMLSDCIREMRNAPDTSTYAVPSIIAPPQWQADMGRFPFLGRRLDLKPRRYPRNRVFVYKNASTDWHYHDFDETLTSQLIGRKRISLFRLSRENWNAYSQPIRGNFHHFSCSHQFFPRDRALVKFEGVLEAGDSVYIPPFWWHGIDPADADFGVTHAHCFRTPLKRFGHWEEPATRIAINEARGSYRRLLPLLASVMASVVSRKMSREQWRLL
jgi:hypothetical protein